MFNETLKICLNQLTLEMNNQKAHVENEIKKYATEKPDQVVMLLNLGYRR